MTNTTAHATLDDIPQELVDAIVDLVPRAQLRTSALIGRRWVRRCQERLFVQLTLSSQATERWTRPVLEGQPLLFSYVRTLILLGVYPRDWMNANFQRHMSYFGGGGGGSSPAVNDTKPCRVHTLKLMDSSVDLDGEVISQVLGPIRSTVRTVIMGSVSIPPVMDTRPFLCMFSNLQDVHIPGPQFSSIVPHGESRLAKEFTLPPLNGELRLLFLYHGVEGVLSSLSKLPLRFRSITVSPPAGQCDREINNILAVCGKTVKRFHVTRMKLDVMALRPITLSPCTELEEIRISLRDARDPGPGTIHLFDSVASPHLYLVVFHLVIPLSSRKIDSSIYPGDWTGVDEGLYRLAGRLRVMQESRSSALDTTPSWTMSRPKKEMKRLKVMIEARFLLVPLSAEKVDLGAFLYKFREVGDVIFVPQKIRTLNDDQPAGWSTSPY